MLVGQQSFVVLAFSLCGKNYHLPRRFRACVTVGIPGALTSKKNRKKNGGVTATFPNPEKNEPLG
jgi:hypothetical protein